MKVTWNQLLFCNDLISWFIGDKLVCDEYFSWPCFNNTCFDITLYSKDYFAALNIRNEEALVNLANIFRTQIKVGLK